MDFHTPTPQSGKATKTDDFFDDFDFKPLSKGLGFHHGNKQEEAVKEATRIMVERAAPARTSGAKPIHPFEQHQLQKPVASESSRDFIQSDLALFYGAKAEPQLQLAEDLPVARPASLALRGAAFAIDLMFVVCLTLASLHAVAWLTGLDLWSEVMAFESSSLTAVVVLFSSYFMLYFTLLEKFQGKSLGKDLMGLIVVSDEKMTIDRVFTRALVTLLGFLSLGLTNWVDLPNKISRTKVVQES
jgi:hypothetical protein